MLHDDANAVTFRMAPPGYVTMHVHRQTSTRGKVNHGSGLAIIYHELSTPNGQFERIRVWSSDVLAAEAKKAERTSEDTRLIPKPPSRNWNTGLDPLTIAKLRITNGQDAPA